MYRGELIVSDESEQKPEAGISVIPDRGTEQAKRGTEQTKQEAAV